MTKPTLNRQKIMQVNIDAVAYALTLTVGAMLVLFVGAVTCAAVCIYFFNKPGEDDE